MDRAHCEPMYSFTMFTRCYGQTLYFAPYQFKCVILQKMTFCTVLHTIRHEVLITSPAYGVNHSRCSKRKEKARKRWRSYHHWILTPIFLTSVSLHQALKAQAANRR